MLIGWMVLFFIRRRREGFLGGRVGRDEEFRFK